jgi:hypothetical protein
MAYRGLPLLILVPALALAACGLPGTRVSAPPAEGVAAPDDMPRPRARPDAATANAPAIGGTASRPAEAFDTTTEAERVAATAPSGAGRVLGTVTAALGNPAEPGFWMLTALVDAPQPGVVRLPSGATAQVELRPGSGAALLSLAAFRALGLGLTDLPQLTVETR